MRHLAEVGEFPEAHLMHDFAGVFVAIVVGVFALEFREISQGTLCQFRSEDERLISGDQGIPSEGAGIPRDAGADVGAGFGQERRERLEVDHAP